MATFTQWFGFNPPFLTKTEVIPTQTGLRLIKNDILQLLLTSPKERVMRPTFGTLIRKTPFEPNDSNTVTSLKSEIFEAISQNETRVSVRSIVINSNPDDGNIFITIYCFLKNDPNETVFPVETEFISPTRAIDSAPIRQTGIS